MVKRFTIWMEDRQQQKELTGKLLRYLGYDRDALDAQDVILNNRIFADIETAIKRLTIDTKNQQDMIDFVKDHQKKDGSIFGLSLKALAAIIKPNDAEVQDTSSSVPAVIPQANQPAPKPMLKQNQPPEAAGFGPMF